MLPGVHFREADFGVFSFLVRYFIGCLSPSRRGSGVRRLALSADVPLWPISAGEHCKD
jgi:hypothetical protein